MITKFVLVAAAAFGLSTASLQAASADSALHTRTACTSYGTTSCAAVLCPAGYVCVPAPKQCFTVPCPQFDCVPATRFATPPSRISLLLNVSAHIGSPAWNRATFYRPYGRPAIP
ncbi:hypothetical protein Pth03_74290 [Planotetraspora thailandica]|uniref:Uncharacterized protein n=1 Tax=Planotetraspora thailandica TaxID=487172 RepID=A0A8J4DF10_9ACTN|nr:hypothetical protein [Planotetraspora thailandica]GII59040.1 hypothetical protein Pth03_74290 [Planotetraspora thailandica]